MRLRLQNRGLLGVTNTITQRLFISTDPVPGNDTLAAQVDYTGPLGIDQFIDQTVTIRMPSTPGNYWLVAVADVNDTVLEAVENNNTLISTSSILVQSAYTATVATDMGTALANTPVPMYGQATLAGSSTPAALVPVTIDIEVRGMRRQLAVITGADGRFTNVFQPLPNEAGVYHIAAAYPGVANPLPQDTFNLLGISIAPVGLVNVIEAGSVSGSTRIDNLSDVPLTGLNAVVVTHQPNLVVTVSLSTNTLGGLTSATLGFGITALDASTYQSPIALRVTSAEGVVANVTLTVRVEALRPRLTANPASLESSMRRGAQTTVPFT